MRQNIKECSALKEVSITKQTSINQLVEDHLPYAQAIATKEARYLPRGYDHDEIISNARMGLLEAAMRFEPHYNVNFKTFAYYRIKGAIYDGLQKNGWVSRFIYSKIRQIKEKTERVQSITKKISDSTSQIGTQVNSIRQTLRYLSPVALLSFNTIENDENNSTAGDYDTEELVSFKELKEKLREDIQNLPDMQRQIITMYYFQNLTLGQIATKLNVSKSWISRLHTSTVAFLQKKYAFQDTPQQ